MNWELHAQVEWQWWSSMVAAGIVAGSCVAYVRGWRRLRRHSPERAARLRPWAFASGMLAAWFVIGSPASALDRQLLTFHMVQHLVLMTIAAPLLLAARPALALRSGAPRWIAYATKKLRQSETVRALGNVLRHPVACWLAGTVVVVAWHVPVAHHFATSSPTWHLIQQLSFLAGGMLFWRPVMGRGPNELFVPVYLLLATFPCDALSGFLAFCGRVVYACHRAALTFPRLSPLQDQQCAAALMWFWVTIAYLAPAIAVTLRLLSRRPGQSAIQGGPA
jgi:putative membrane protein